MGLKPVSTKLGEGQVFLYLTRSRSAIRQVRGFFGGSHKDSCLPKWRVNPRGDSGCPLIAGLNQISKSLLGIDSWALLAGCRSSSGGRVTHPSWTRFVIIDPTTQCRERDCTNA